MKPSARIVYVHFPRGKAFDSRVGQNSNIVLDESIGWEWALYMHYGNNFTNFIQLLNINERHMYIFRKENEGHEAVYQNKRYYERLWQEFWL